MMAMQFSTIGGPNGQRAMKYILCFFSQQCRVRANAMGANSPALAGSKSIESRTLDPSGRHSTASKAAWEYFDGFSGKRTRAYTAPPTAKAISKKIQRRSSVFKNCNMSSALVRPKVRTVDPQKNLQ